MNKKLLMGLGVTLAVVASVAAMSAYEAHVINVTAKIENALSVDTTPIHFGTIFPQEELDYGFDIALSQSFLDETRVDDVEYIIRQKPKCAITADEGETFVGPTATGHIVLDPATGEIVGIDCGDAPRQLEPEEDWGPLPLLCPYLSKHKDIDDQDGDEEMDAFHPIGRAETGDLNSTYYWVWNSIMGRLSKKAQDIVDSWVIDLKVPCFGGHCAQDWASFVTGINPDANPDDYVLPIEDEHKYFGCDLWIEVTHISLPNGDIGCEDKADVMLVLDESGSIDPTELGVLKTAAIAFVNALAPSTPGIHMGEVSFSTTAVLDVHLTDNGGTVITAINNLVSGGLTNLEHAIQLADLELDNPGDGHDRPDADSSDYMVIITDGEPTTSNSGGNYADDAEAAATAAKADGITIYVVGVGTDSGTADYLRNKIASTPGHYYDASNWDQLQAILEGLGSCP